MNRRQVRTLLEEAWGRLQIHLRQETRGAREVLRTLLAGPLLYGTEGPVESRRVWFKGRIALDRLIGEAVPVSQLVASPVFASWNQLEQWLRAVDGLRQAA